MFLASFARPNGWGAVYVLVGFIGEFRVFVFNPASALEKRCLGL